MPKEHAEYARRYDTPLTPETRAYIDAMDAKNAAEYERAEEILSGTFGTDWEEQLAAGKIGPGGLLLVVKIAGREAV